MARDGDPPDYRVALTELAARKGFTVWHYGGLVEIKDARMGELIFTSPTSQHAYGVLLDYPDRDDI